MADVTGRDALTLVPTGSDDLVAQLNKADKFPAWTLLALLAALFVIIGMGAVGKSPGGGIALILLGVLLLALSVVVGRKQSIENLVPVEYTLEGAIPEWVAQMQSTWVTLSRLSAAWRITQSGRVETLYQQKTNAGASSLISRTRATFSTAHPKVLVPNIAVPSVSCGSTTIYFLPDRLLVRTGRRWTDVGYTHLSVSAHSQRFIEDETPPRDSQRVGTTWKYVNKGGGPDRRFKDNKQLPIMLYGRIELSSQQGLSWIIDTSVSTAAEALARCLTNHPPAVAGTQPAPADVPPVPAAPVVPVPETEPSDAAVAEYVHERAEWLAAKEAEILASVDAKVRAATGARSERDTQGHGSELSDEKADYVPPIPKGERLEPWGRPSVYMSVAGERYHSAEVAAVIAERKRHPAKGYDMSHADAVLVPDANNPHGEGHAIAVYVYDKHVGYLPHEQSRAYFPAVASMTGAGNAVTVVARLAPNEDTYMDHGGHILLRLPEAKEMLPPETMPDDENAVILPLGSPVQVTGEEEHIDYLAPHLGHSVAVTLHTVTEQRARSTVDLIEVRLEGEPVGRFTPTTTKSVGPLVSHVEAVGGLPVARAAVSGNSLKVDVTVFVEKAGYVPQEWLDSL